MNKLSTLILCLVLTLFILPDRINAQACSGDSPLSYTVIQAGATCLLQINWNGSMPEIACGTPGTPAAGSNVPNNRDLIDLSVTVNGTTYVLYDRGNGGSCNGAVLGLVYGPEANSYITVSSNADFCQAAGEASIAINGNQTGASAINCALANGNVPQPVELVSFRGHAMDKSNILSWETESEENAMVFVLERSRNGKAPFDEIGSVPAAGFSSSRLAYQFFDEKPLPVSYYRLRNVDFDGATEYSDLIVVERPIGNIFDVIAFPVPFRSDQPIQVYFEALKEEKARIILSDPLGRMLYMENVVTKAGVNRIEFDIQPAFNSELYILSIDNGKEVIVKKIIGGTGD